MIEDNVMRIVIVGGGASSLMCANMIKLYDEKSEVLIIEKNDKLGKKLKMTGNGKCNLAPAYDNYKLLTGDPESFWDGTWLIGKLEEK